MMIEGTDYKKETEVTIETSVIQLKKLSHIWKNKGHGQKAQWKKFALETLSALL